MNNTGQRDLIVRYLLDQTTPEERATLEARYMEDDAFFQELVDTENELVDSYVRGEMASSERQEFERYYLTIPERHERVANARAIQDLRRQDARPVRRSRMQSGALKALALTAAVLIVGFLLFRVAVENYRTRFELQQARRHEQELQQQIEALKSQIQALQNAPPAQTGQIVALALSPGLVRGGAQGKTLTIPQDATAVRIDLYVEGADFAEYSAALETPEGSTLWRRTGLHSQPDREGVRAVRIEAPASEFRSGDYVLKLTGGRETAGVYGFRVVRKH